MSAQRITRLLREDLPKNKSRTNWKRVRKMSDREIEKAAESDPDAEMTDRAFWKDAHAIYPTGGRKMSKLEDLIEPCRKILKDVAAKRERTETPGKIAFRELAQKLGLPHHRKQWSKILHPIYEMEWEETERDLTLVVVYSSGRLAGFPPYLSRRGAAGSVQFNPDNEDHRRQYEEALEALHTYHAERGVG